MANWQYDFHLLPGASAIQHFGAMPAVISDAAFDNVSWWKGFPDAVPGASQLGNLLPDLQSWNDCVKRWGVEDGNRIDALYGLNGLEDIFVRVDVRDISVRFISEILSLARSLNLIVRLPDGRIIRPSPQKLLEAIRISDSAKFVADPKSFFQTIEDQTDAD